MRDLTQEERAVLEHVVVDADAWWAHANNDSIRVDAEAAIASKVERHKDAYEAALAAEGDNYKNRVQRDADVL